MMEELDLPPEIRTIFRRNDVLHGRGSPKVDPGFRPIVTDRAARRNKKGPGFDKLANPT
jgi:hypothetical protein